ncbi:hypothetical protein LPW11_00010 [Geomonas sp. RF6]|uniref:hypothetical protein n=1 Tax=Geomonas sp. RF6 TaxID=2897342 RepID=UPI001E659180|nr:hypothetical protein [Geomonas sp. RF6]UFS70594.1 hypothetical protein LPW11_00010 [Geomonas sp. RF6]
MKPAKSRVVSADPEVPVDPPAVEFFYTPYYCTWYRTIFPAKNPAQVAQAMESFIQNRGTSKSETG